VLSYLDEGKLAVQVSGAYRVLLENLPVYQKLFRLKYREGVCDLGELCEHLGFEDVEEVVLAERRLSAHLKFVMGGFVRKDKLGEVCSECLQLGLSSLGSDGEEIRPSCRKCGLESEDVADVENMNTDLDRAVTYAPVSKISYSKGGCTFNPNSDREHKNFFWNIVNERNVLFSKFPEVAAEFKAEVGEADSFECVWAGSNVYCRVGPWVRHVSIDEYFNLVNSFWHVFDAPLQKSKLSLIIEPKSEFRRSKEYALRLLETYGFNNKDRDQAVYNTVGRDIERLKPFVDARVHHVSEKTFAETIVYICLVRFDKKGMATKIKSELDINLGLVNFIDGVLELLREDAVKMDNNPMLLDTLERQNGLREEIAV
jgi:hypothetical protein